MRRSSFIAALAILFMLTGPPATRPAPPEVRSSERDWHAGLNLRTDFGTHPVRIDAGVRFRSLDFILVLDPMFWTDGQHDVDILVDWTFASGWSALFGWRVSSIALAGGRHWHQKSLVGIAGRLPALASGHIRAQAGLELAILWVKHGGGLPVDSISFASARHVSDNLHFGFFLRFEYAAGF